MRSVARIAIVLICLLAISGCSFIFSRPMEKFIVYRVQSGDTLKKLARDFGVTVDTLQEVNRLWDPDELSVGQVLRIPYRGQAIQREAPESKESRPQAAASEARRVQLSDARRYVGKLLWPVSAGEVTSAFGYRWLTFHEGIDISGREGTPIYAAHDGTVVYSGQGLRGYGNLIVLKADGLLTVYAHNRRNLARRGERVRRGDKIAELGMSGKATGPHLHFETRIRDATGKNAAVNPMAFYPSR